MSHDACHHIITLIFFKIMLTNETDCKVKATY